MQPARADSRPVGDRHSGANAHFAVTQFRLTPLLSQETREAAEKFHEALNDAVKRTDRTQQTFKDECCPHQKQLQALIRRDLAL